MCQVIGDVPPQLLAIPQLQRNPPDSLIKALVTRYIESSISRVIFKSICRPFKAVLDTAVMIIGNAELRSKICTWYHVHFSHQKDIIVDEPVS
jgi:hypothetical protein